MSNVSAAVAKLQPEKTVARERDDGAEASTEGGAEVIVIGGEWRGEDEGFTFVGLHRHAHRGGERDLVVKEALGLLQQRVVAHGIRGT